MLKLPVFKIIPLIESYYIEQTGNKKISLQQYRSMKTPIRKMKKSIKEPLKWIYIDTGKLTPVLLKKSGNDHIFITGSLSMKKAKTEKDLEYWKKMLLDVLKMEKSLEDIMFPGKIIKSLHEDVQELLIKARGFNIGTKRTWRGKEYKKVAGGPKGKGKWVRTYVETESRGAKQAIGNVRRKIENAASMEELMQIIKENSSRFKDEEGKMLPIVKEFMTAVRGTEAGAKEKIPEPEKRSFVGELKDLIEEAGQTYNADINKLVNGVMEADLSLRAGKYMGKKLTDIHREVLEKERDKYAQRIKDLLDKKKEAVPVVSPEEASEPIPIENPIEETKPEIQKLSYETMSLEDAEDLVYQLNEKVKLDGVEFFVSGEEEDLSFVAEVDRPDFTDNIEIDPYEFLEKDIKDIMDLLSIENKDIPKEEPKTDYEAQEKAKEKKTPIKPDTEPVTGVEAQITLEEANPVNRQEKTLEIAGTLPEAKTEEEVINEQGTDKIKPEEFTRDITLNTGNMGIISGKISGIDTSVIDHREVLLTSYKSIQKVGNDWKDVKPDWMPDIDYNQFDKSNNSLIFTILPDGKYLVPIAQKYKPHGSKRKYKYASGPWIEDEADSFKGTEYALMSLGQVAATQDFYRKVSKSLNDAKYQERVTYYKEKGYTGKPKKSRIKVLAQNRMLYDHSFIYKEVNGADNTTDSWKVHKELQSSLKQKTIDMDLMKEEVDNAFSKGNETSYGDSNTSDALESEYGIKIKRQDGSNITLEDQKYLSDAMSSVQNTFGERISMNESFGLKLSFAKGTAMHARKAVGLFVPSQKAIGISDGKGLKKKHPITGEMLTVNYGDENFGGFVLSHEYAHMMDYYLGSKTGEWYASDNNNSTAGQIASEFRSNMNTEFKSDYINRTCECFARALEQYHAIESVGPTARSFDAEYVSEGQYVSKDIYDTKIKPLVEKFLQENDQLLKAIDIIW